MNARTISYHALKAWKKNGTFIWDFLEKWKASHNPDPRECNFAYELSCQTVRLFGYLEFFARKHLKKLPQKQNERILLYLALYQILFLQNIPRYAIVNEMVEIAKKESSQFFSRFLNSFLKKEFTLDAEEVIVKYSYPQFLFDTLTKQYGEKKAFAILKKSNEASEIFCTVFDKGEIFSEPYSGQPGYIQNKTPVELILSHTKGLEPKNIIDLCAAPGGKTLLLSHLFPESALFANDLPQKCARLKSNIAQFNRQVTITEGKAEEFSHSEAFDLIVLDAPCSNSGVLYKCPEARWRITEKSIQEHQMLQLSLLKHAKNLLSKKGVLIYLTCSILQEENEHVVEKAKELGLTCIKQSLQLPDDVGHHGGFAANFTFCI